MRILCCDFALKNCGYAILEDDKVVSTWVFKPDTKDYYSPTYLALHRANFWKIIADNNEENGRFDAFIIEGPSFASNGQMVSIGALFGTLQMAAFDANIPTLIFQPARWKKLAVGSGKAKKPEIKAALLDYVPKHKGIQQDEYDAAGMGRAFFEAVEIYKGKKVLKPLRDIVTGEGGIFAPDSVSGYLVDEIIDKL